MSCAAGVGLPLALMAAAAWPQAVVQGAPAASASASASASAAPAGSAASAASAAAALPVSAEPIELRTTPSLTPPPRGDAARALPIILRAQSVTGRPDLEMQAEGDAEFRRGDLRVRADRLGYDTPTDLATARGNVRILRDGNLYTGPELQLKVQRFEGFFLNPTYQFARTGAGGQAKRVDFSDEERAIATGATYTSCLPDGSGSPAWLLSTDRVAFDFAANEGVAEGGVLRFYGVPILAAPRMSFPLTDARKSGWLPPSFGLDTKSGVQASVPYYWNIAPNRDATITPEISLRRGPSLGSEFRYLEPGQRGEVRLIATPRDLLTDTTRYALAGTHEGDFGNAVRLEMRLLRVSDNDYWKDHPRDFTSLTPRLLESDLRLSRPFGENWSTYARLQRWQVLQGTEPENRIEAPYERSPQLGARYLGRVGPGLELGLETEFNRFTNPTDASLTLRPEGTRVHALGSVSRPFVTPGFSVVPKLAFNAASYSVDAGTAGGPRTSASRVIPTLSLDSAWVLERDTTFFGRAVRQTLEPRLLYVNTPYTDPSRLPNFDAYAKDFNFDSIFTDNAFSGVDRVSDAHQITAGVTTRVLDSDTGAEQLRLGVAQRYLLRDQLVSPTGTPLTQRFSDLLLLGSTTLIPAWTLDASIQYAPESNRVARSVIGARYSPGPFRTVNVRYRFTRGLSEQLELGWQWPIHGPTPLEARGATSAGASDRGGSGGGPGSAGGSACQGSWYGVGRISYSTRDRRLTDSIAGIEYDAGCWIGRIVASRQSTGFSEATTRLSVQLELVGLSRLTLGSNPLNVLKDNVPGFRLLREGRGVADAPSPHSSTYD